MLGEFIVTIVVLGVIAIIVILVTISKLLLISHPNEVIILSGRKRTLPNGDIVGYRIIRGGRALRLPLIEKASRMSLETIPIELAVTNAYSKGGIPLAVDAIANIKIDSKEPQFGNAVERFLNMSEAEIQKIAKETLEGNLRGVLASLTPEEVNEDRMKFAEVLMDEAEVDLQKLGIQLDTLKITNISDERGYLNSIGRMKTAEVLAHARKAEADRQAEAEEAEAGAVEKAEKAKARAKQEIERAKIESDQSISIAKANQIAVTQEAEATSNERAEKAKALAKQEIETAQVSSDQNVAIAKAKKTAEAREAEAAAFAKAEKANAIAKQEIEQTKIEAEMNVKVANAQAGTNIEIENNKLRVIKAELERDAIIKEKEAIVAGIKAQVKFEQEVEQERIDLQKKKLAADVIEPAKARKEALELEAKGEAAKIIADGDAKIFVLNQTIQAFLSAQGNGEKVFMLNMLPELVEKLSDTVKGVNIDKISIIDSGNGESGQIPKLLTQLPGSVVSMVEMLENATGVDILSALKNKKSSDKA